MFGCCTPITDWFVHAGVTVDVVSSAVIKENGVIVEKIFIADISNVDPGIDGAESTFQYSRVQVEVVGGGVPYIIEQVASLVAVQCFDKCIACFFEWCVGVCWDVDCGDYWGTGSTVCGVVGGDEI